MRLFPAVSLAILSAVPFLAAQQAPGNPTGPETAASASPGASPVAGPASDAAAGLWTNTGEDGIRMASKDRWYLEEFDDLGRPVSAVLWLKAEISERTKWVYEGASQMPAKKTVSGKDRTTETSYDEAGNELVVTVTAAAGPVISRTENRYDDKERLISTETVAGGKSTKTEFFCAADGSLERKTVSVDGVLVLECTYADSSGDNRSETVYDGGKPVLTVEYRDGSRTGRIDETEK